MHLKKCEHDSQTVFFTQCASQTWKTTFSNNGQFFYLLWITIKLIFETRKSSLIVQVAD